MEIVVAEVVNVFLFSNRAKFDCRSRKYISLIDLLKNSAIILGEQCLASKISLNGIQNLSNILIFS